MLTIKVCSTAWRSDYTWNCSRSQANTVTVFVLIKSVVHEEYLYLFFVIKRNFPQVLHFIHDVYSDRTRSLRRLFKSSAFNFSEKKHLFHGRVSCVIIQKYEKSKRQRGKLLGKLSLRRLRRWQIVDVNYLYKFLQVWVFVKFLNFFLVEKIESWCLCQQFYVCSLYSVLWHPSIQFSLLQKIIIFIKLAMFVQYSITTVEFHIFSSSLAGAYRRFWHSIVITEYDQSTHAFCSTYV